ncbi:helix-turn-helix domain-containing protein [Gracilibacillus thailandensis]|uniref:HTH cro/C1-type domain-containing protein n=1 Tax=Gracilibacillus thailandensis TaxID=563735 RepID=A0A6N7QZ76_9BACI|nr:helix-turn-helix transcriptional regulator [Gracilibacillus thailandensis]MRI66191.1 hypothetical protein [Gracilibacillus thailandensis]
MELNHYIRKLRGNESARKIADRAGISHSYWLDIENGYSRASGKSVKPSKKILVKIAKALAETNRLDGKEITFKLFELAGFTEKPKQVNSPFTICKIKNESLESDTFDYPVNDLNYHLEDLVNQKYYKNILLNDRDLKFIKKVIESYLETYKGTKQNGN